MDPSKFFNRKINIRNPKTPYGKGKFIDESQNYSSRISSRINQSPLTKSLFTIRNKIFQIENILVGLFNLDKKKQDQKKKIKAAEVPDKKLKTKGPQIFGKLIQRPKTGALDLIRDFVTFTFLGWLFTRIQPLLGGLTKLKPLLDGAAWFIGGTIKNMIDIFATFLKLGFDAKEKFDDLIKGIKDNAEGINKTFDDTLTALKGVFGGTIELANSFLNVSVKEDELNEAKTVLAKEETVENFPPLPPLPSVDEPRMPETFGAFSPTTTIQKLNTGGIVRGYNEGGRIDPRTPVTRGVETQRREVPKPRPTIQPQKTAPGKDVGGDKKIKQLYDQTSASSIADFIPLPSFFRSDKKSGFAALMGASEEYKKPMTNDILGIGNMMGASVDSALGQKIEKKSYTQFADGIRYLVNYGRTQPEEFAKIDLEDMVRKIVEPRVNMAINRIQEEINKKSAVELQPSPSEGGGEFGEPAVGAGEMDLFKRLVYAEAGGEGLIGMALVARSVLNRTGLVQSGTVGPGTYLATGKTLTDIIMAPRQYTPVSDGSINKQFSVSQINQAMQAIELAKDPNKLIEKLRSEKIPEDQITKLMASTGFRNYEAGAGDDPSQKVNEIRYKQHTFNTAGNTNLLVPRGVAIALPSAVSVEGGTLPSGKIYSKAGMRLHPFHGDMRMHYGNDYAMPTGTLISSVVGGEVVYSGSMGNYGNTIDIKHPDGSKTRYTHLQDIRVKSGQRVTTGMVIGTVGSTGRSTGPHLHFEYFYPNGNRETNWQKLNNIADKKFRFGGNVKPTEVQKLAKKDGKEGYINPQGTFVERKWTPEEKGRFEVEIIKKNQQLSSSPLPSGPPLPRTLSQKEIREYIEKIEKMKPGSEESLKIPGVGTFVRGKNWAGMAEDKYFHPDGRPMSQKEFADKLNRMIKTASPLSGSISSKPLSAPEKYLSYEQPVPQESLMAIQPLIINNPIPVPVSSGVVPFAVPIISNSTSQLT